MIEVSNLSKKYKSRMIIDHVNLTIYNKGIHFLLGKNGAGKSTFIKCLLNLEKYFGTITYDGQPYQHQKSKVFAVYDDSALYQNLTGFQNIMLLTDLNVAQINQVAHQYLSQDLLKKKVKKYSLGEKKKIFLIVIELIKPKVIIMDEVSSGLDYETIKILKNKLIRWSEDSCLILTGHQFDFYNDIIDRLFIVANHDVQEIDLSQKKKLEEIYDKFIN